jgi:1-aminocyclopropane-1-carboxylate deaminase/D-cysteine desulfhydrase-like pyridoxal-dependent ACC family enzyme
MIKDNTKLEEYLIRGKRVFVKREDTCATYPLPPLAKLRGVYQRLLKVRQDGYKTVGVFDTKVSMAGYGTGILAKELGLECITFYSGSAEVKANMPPNLIAAKRTCKEVIPVKPGRTPICYSYAKAHCYHENIYMMPQGLACDETSDEVAKIATGVPKHILGGSLVMISGTGTIFSGVIKGLQRLPSRLISISACISPKKQRNNVLKLVGNSQFIYTSVAAAMSTEFIEPIMDYYEEDHYGCPFDCNRHYDRKAWQWLNENIDTLPEPILFWNIGGDYDKIFKEN